MIIVQHGMYVIENDQAILDKIRALPSRTWDSDDQRWKVPFVVECHKMLLDAGFKIRHLEKPTESGYTVDIDKSSDYLILRTLVTKSDVDRCRQIPEYRRFDQDQNGWVFKCTPNNVSYVKGAFEAKWSSAADELVKRSQQPKGKIVYPIDFKYKLKPFDHQLADFHRSRDREFYGFLWDQGTGKTKQMIDTFAWNVQKGKVDAMLVIAPNSVKSTWEDDELPTHTPDWLNPDIFVWDTKTKAKAIQWMLSTSRRPKILVMNVEAVSHASGIKAVDTFVSRWKTLICIDESSIIASHKAKRTKALIKLGKKAVMRRIGDGTPATESPMEYFAQSLFLSPEIFGENFYRFRSKYAIMGGWQGKQIVGYSNLDDLQEKIDQHSSRYLKSDVFDLPPQTFTKREVELTAEQRRMYNELRDELLTETRQGTIEVEHTIVKLTRMHQIIGGFMPCKMFHLDKETGEMEPVEYDRAPSIPGNNPKIEELLAIARQTHDKVIVYCRFKPEMDAVTKALRALKGQSAVVEMRGGMTKDGRSDAKKRFQTDPTCTWMVAQSRAAGRGLTLTASHTVVYFSNDFSLRIRLQTQDRVYRFGQNSPVTYIDLVAKDTMDLHLLKTLRKKKSLADLVSGDPSFSWL